MNYKRVLSGVILFPIMAIIFIFGNTYFVDTLISIIAIMGLYEYYNAFKTKNKPVAVIGYIAAAMLAIIHVIPIDIALKVIAAIIPISILILFLKVIFSNMKTNISDISITFFGIGKHKFTEVSPNKTIEGCIGGVIGAVLLSIVYTIACNKIWNLQINYIFITVISVILSIIGQLGDLAESSIKRYTEIKDTSNLIPGHGGMLDRIDSVLFIAPIAYFLLSFI